MNRNFKRSVSVLGVIAAGSIALTACSESEQATGSSDGKKIEGLSGTTGNLVAEGASSQQKAVDLFGVKYQSAVPGAQFSYTASGSGSGQKQFIAGQVAFGGSDSALKDDQIDAAKQRCGGNDAWHLPLVVGPVAIAYNLNGQNITLTPEVAAKIFKGEIKKWNDPAIVEHNKDAKLPETDIKVVYRSEESGTTDNFQKFLKSTSNGVWEGSGKSFPSGTGAGAQGSTGVVDEVKATPGAITYVESGFAKDANLGIAKIDFGKGAVELSKDSVNKALAKAAFKGEGHDLVVDSTKLFEMQEDGAYPLVLTTYEIVCSKGYDNETKGRVKDFLTVALENQSDELEQIGYIPLSGEYKDKIKAAVDAIG